MAQPRLRPEHHSRYHQPLVKMSWLTSWFSSSRNDKLSRGGALSSTSEAFSLPVSSPVTATHPDAFNTDSLAINEPDSANRYSYPPGRNGPYGYVSTGYALILAYMAAFFGSYYLCSVFNSRQFSLRTINPTPPPQHSTLPLRPIPPIISHMGPTTCLAKQGIP